jgi:hypothetical protein
VETIADHDETIARADRGRRLTLVSTGRPSITRTERPRSANLLQMPRVLMCKLRRRGRDYEGHRHTGYPGIDPSLQPLPLRSNCWAAIYGRAAIPRPGHAFNLTANTGPVCPACSIGVALFATLFCICEWSISAIFRSGSPNETAPARGSTEAANRATDGGGIGSNRMLLALDTAKRSP